MPADEHTRAEYLRALLNQKKATLNQSGSLLNPSVTQGSELQAIDAGAKMGEQNQNQQERNWWQRIWDTADEFLSNVTGGIVDFADSIGDAVIYAAGGIGSWFGADTEWAQNAIAYDWNSQATNALNQIELIGDIMTGDLFNGNWAKDWGTLGSAEASQQNINKLHENSYTKEAGDGFNKYYQSITQGIGNVLPSIALGIVTGGSSTGVQIAVGGGSALLQGFGASTEEALGEGATYGQAGAAGLVGGAIEAGTELASMGIAKGIGAASSKLAKGGVEAELKALSRQGLDTASTITAHILGRAVGKEVSELTVKEIVSEMVEEGAEEWVSEMLRPLIKSTYQGSEAFDEWWDSDKRAALLDDAAVAFVGGAAGGAFGAFVAPSITNKMFEKEGQTSIQAINEINKLNIQEAEILNSGNVNQSQIEQIRNTKAELVKAFGNNMAELRTKHPAAFKRVVSLLNDPQLFKNKEFRRLSTSDQMDFAYKQITNSFSENGADIIVGNINNMYQRAGLRNRIQFVDNVNEALNKGKDVIYGKDNSVKGYIDRSTGDIFVSRIYENEIGALVRHEGISHAILDSNKTIRDNLSKAIEEDKSLYDKFHSKDEQIKTTYKVVEDSEVFKSEQMASFLEDVLFDQKKLAKVFGRNALTKSNLKAILNRIKNYINLNKNDTNTKILKAIDQSIEYLKQNGVYANDLSIVADNDGNELTKAQQEFFKDSKVRDRAGNLIQTIHITDKEFTIFDDKRFGKGAGQIHGNGFYFFGLRGENSGVDSKLANYIPKGNSVVSYLKIDNPLMSNKKMSINEFKTFAEKSITSDKLEGDLFLKTTYWKDLKSIFDNSSNNEQILLQFQQWAKEQGYKKDGFKTDTRKGLKALGYDGIIIDRTNSIKKSEKISVIDNGKVDWNKAEEFYSQQANYANEYIVFDSNQIKNIDNLRPTTSDDIRFSKDPVVGKYEIGDNKLKSQVKKVANGYDVYENGKLVNEYILNDKEINTNKETDTKRKVLTQDEVNRYLKKLKAKKVDTTVTDKVTKTKEGKKVVQKVSTSKKVTGNWLLNDGKDTIRVEKNNGIYQVFERAGLITELKTDEEVKNFMAKQNAIKEVKDNPTRLKEKSPIRYTTKAPVYVKDSDGSVLEKQMISKDGKFSVRTKNLDSGEVFTNDFKSWKEAVNSIDSFTNKSMNKENLMNKEVNKETVKQVKAAEEFNKRAEKVEEGKAEEKKAPAKKPSNEKVAELRKENAQLKAQNTKSKKARELFKDTFKLAKHLNSEKTQLSKLTEVKNVGRTGQDATLQASIAGVFYDYYKRFNFTKANYASPTNVLRLKEMLDSGQLKTFCENIFNEDHFINPNDKQAKSFGIIEKVRTEHIMELAEAITAEYKSKYTQMTDNQVKLFDELNGAISKYYQEYKQLAVDNTRGYAANFLERAKTLAENAKTSNLKNTITEKMLDAASPRSIIALMTGGTYTQEFDMLYNQLYKTPYENQLRQANKFKTELTGEKNANVKTISKHALDKVTIGGKKVLKRAVYNIYLNSLSEDNWAAIKKSNKLSYTNKTRVDFTFDECVEALSTLTAEEKAELNHIFKVYNTSVTRYVGEISENIFGTRMVRSDYFPRITSKAFQLQDFTKGATQLFEINALNNNRLKSVKARAFTPELNVDPIAFFNQYIDSMTITGEVGFASQKMGRLFNLKIDGVSYLSELGKFIPNASTYVSSIYNKLISNVQLTTDNGGIFGRMLRKWANSTLFMNVRSIGKQFASFFTAWGKVGVKNGFKTMVNVPHFVKSIFSKKTHQKLIANNPVFANRIAEHGYIKGLSLSNGPAEFTSNIMQKLGKIGIFGMELNDRITCYTTFALCEQYVKTEYGYKIGTDKNFNLANKMFTDIILETQSNSDRIAMSMIRSGEKGFIKQTMFGMFVSDLQNKFSQVVTSVTDNQNVSRDIKRVESQIKEAKTKKETASLNKKLASLQKSQAKVKVETRGAVAGIVMSAMFTVLVDMIADWIYDKKDPEDEEVTERLIELLGNATIDWIPYFNQIYNWIKYDGATIGYIELGNALIKSFKSLSDGNVTKQDLLNFAISLAEFNGIGVKNVSKLIQGFIGNFDPEKAYEYKSLTYAMSSQYLSKELKSNVEKGKDKKALAALNYLIDNYKLPNTSEQIRQELLRLYKGGYNAIPSSIPSSLTVDKQEIELDSNQITIFTNIYSYSTNDVNALLNVTDYKSADDETKSKLISKVYSTYYEVAKAKTLGSTSGLTKIGKLLYFSNGKISIAKYVAMLNTLNNIEVVGNKTKKDLIIAKLNKDKSISKEDKLLLMYLLGYTMDEKNEKTLKQYLERKGVDKKIWQE